jgi:hypothetical protein
MRLNQGFDVILEAGDPVIVTPHEKSGVTIHGYGDNNAYLTWGVQFIPCEEHIRAVEKLLTTLETMRAAATAGKEAA